VVAVAVYSVLPSLLMSPAKQTVTPAKPGSPVSCRPLALVSNQTRSPSEPSGPGMTTTNASSLALTVMRLPVPVAVATFTESPPTTTGSSELLSPVLAGELCWSNTATPPKPLSAKAAAEIVNR